jgi:hypothetical protein
VLGAVLSLPIEEPDIDSLIGNKQRFSGESVTLKEYCKC